jgi:hypothetical protein
MFEILGQNILGENILVQDNKADTIGRPSDHVLVLIILNRNLAYIQQFVGLL